MDPDGQHLGADRAALFAAVATVLIMVQPHLALGLPGHRALTWLALIILGGLLGGRGWPTVIGAAAALGTEAIGRSPHGLTGVLQYVLAGVLVDVVLSRVPSNPRWRISTGALMGASVLAAVGWVSPVTKGLAGGVPFGSVFESMEAVPASAWARLVLFDVTFGAGAGALAVIGHRVLAPARPAGGAPIRHPAWLRFGGVLVLAGVLVGLPARRAGAEITAPIPPWVVGADQAGPFEAGTQVHVTALCPAGSTLTGGGFWLRVSSGGVPSNSLRSRGGSPVGASGSAAPAAGGGFTAVGGAGGQPLVDALTGARAICMTDASLGVQFVTSSAPGPRLPASTVSATAVCPEGTVLFGGGAATSVSPPSMQPGLHLVSSMPSDSSGAPPRDGGSAQAWTAIAGAGGGEITGAETTATAICVSGPVSVSIAAKRTTGPEEPSTPRSATALCPSGTALTAGGIRAANDVAALQQGVHLTGSSPTDANGDVIDSGVASGWTGVVQSGGQPAPGTSTTAFAVCVVGSSLTPATTTTSATTTTTAVTISGIPPETEEAVKGPGAPQESASGESAEADVDSTPVDPGVSERGEEKRDGPTGPGKAARSPRGSRGSTTGRSNEADGAPRSTVEGLVPPGAGGDAVASAPTASTTTTTTTVTPRSCDPADRCETSSSVMLEAPATDTNAGLVVAGLVTGGSVAAGSGGLLVRRARSSRPILPSGP